MKISLKQILVFSLYLSLALLLIIQAKDVYEAYQSKKTMFSISLNEEAEMYIPAITLCPGNIFNIVKLKSKYNLSFDIIDGLPPLQSNNTMLDYYRDVSYVLNKDFEIEFYDYTKKSPNHLVKLDLGANSKSSLGTINVTEMFTFINGLCHVITSDFTIKGSYSPLIFFVKFHTKSPNERPGKFVVFVGELEEMHGLIYTSFKGTMPYSAEIEIGHSTTTFLNKHEWNYLGEKGSCKKDTTSYDYQQCFANEFTQGMLGFGIVNCTSFGSNELFKISNLSLPLCSSARQKLSNTSVFEVFQNCFKNCQKPCKLNQYIGYPRKYAVSSAENRTLIGFVYENNVVATHVEYLLYDSSNFIGTVGGLMGLFLGFSFYDFGTLIIETLYQRLNKRF